MAQLLGTTTFRLASAIVALFVVAAAAIVWLLHAQTNAVLTEQVVAGLRAEAQAMSALARDGGVKALDATVAARSQPGAISLYHLSADGVRIGGNLPSVADLDRLPPEAAEAERSRVADAAGAGRLEGAPAAV